MGLQDIYHYLFVELSVPETRESLFVSSPFLLMLIILGYIFLVVYAGPRYMKNRSSYELRTFILIYDLIQILANAWLVKEQMSAGWLTVLQKFEVKCEGRNVQYLNATKLLSLVWWLVPLKLFDFVETCIFVLRKKQNQVSVLHVYHHVSNLMFLWYYLKYVFDERATFISCLNCLVHVIMYIYYFIVAWNPHLQQRIITFKRFITKLQMMQFIIMIILLMQFLNPKCILPRGCVPIFILNLFLFLYLFYDYYKKQYTSKQKNN